VDLKKQSRFDRVQTLFESDFEKLQNSSILIVGVGGVGGYALDCLYRSGVANITIVDYDSFDITNQNRQIGSQNIGKNKVEVLKELYPNIKTINRKIDIEWVENFNFDSYDIVIDAIDDIRPKVALIKKCYKKIISSMGSAKRVDTTKIEVASIWKSYGDRFAKKVRDELKKDNFRKNFTVVFSSEEPLCKDKGSFVGVTASFGLSICSQTVKRLLK
jgi:tRNA A37 threonylcarbamoyladenosine dehydratase